MCVRIGQASNCRIRFLIHQDPIIHPSPMILYVSHFNYRTKPLQKILVAKLKFSNPNSSYNNPSNRHQLTAPYSVPIPHPLPPNEKSPHRLTKTISSSAALAPESAGSPLLVRAPTPVHLSRLNGPQSSPEGGVAAPPKILPHRPPLYLPTKETNSQQPTANRNQKSVRRVCRYTPTTLTSPRAARPLHRARAAYMSARALAAPACGARTDAILNCWRLAAAALSAELALPVYSPPPAPAASSPLSAPARSLCVCVRV